MDRVTPTRRPEGANAGTQRWRDLLFMHWPVPVELVRPLVPKRLSLDLFEGQLYVGLVPFAMMEVAPSWLPGALALDFLECNLRTYVHLDGEAPGVWFFSLEAASWLAVQAARAGWGLPYHHAAMTSVLDRGHRVYETVRRGGGDPRLLVRYSTGEYLGPSQPATLEYFLLERYLLYAARGERIQRGQVHHSPYPTHRATVHEVDDQLMAAAGLPAPQGLPPLVHFSPGVDVEVFALKDV